MTEYKYQMVNGELVELTPEEIAELERLDAEYAANPPLKSGPLAPQPNANERIDAAMAALSAELPSKEEIQGRRLSEEQLQDYVDGLSGAVRAMLAGFRVIEPRTATASTPAPLAPAKKPTSRKKRT
ncbi:MAG TPA: hypothetical protein VF778_12150 [Xanthobacteraceae bacterium]